MRTSTGDLVKQISYSKGQVKMLQSQIQRSTSEAIIAAIKGDHDAADKRMAAAAQQQKWIEETIESTSELEKELFKRTHDYRDLLMTTSPH